MRLKSHALLARDKGMAVKDIADIASRSEKTISRWLKEWDDRRLSSIFTGHQDNENAQEGIKIMFWGVVAIFVMVSIWGIIGLVQRSLRVQSTEPIIPKGIYYTPPR